MTSRRLFGHAVAISFWTAVAFLWLLCTGCGSVGVDPLWGPVSIAGGSATAAALGGPLGILAGAAIGAGITFAGMWATTPAAQPGAPTPTPGTPTWLLLLAGLPAALFILKFALGPRFRELVLQALKNLTRLDLRGSVRALWQAGGARHSRPPASSSSSAESRS